MIQRILIGFIVAALAILLILWFVTGGPRKVADSARGIANSFNLVFWSATTSAGGFQLPWQPDLSLGADLAAIREAERALGSETPEEELARTEREYDELLKEIEETQTFGESSPYRDMVQITTNEAREGYASEYLEIEAALGNTAPISIAGWSLQSALTGIRAHIPRGADTFILGALNAERDIYLNPGARGIVSSRSAPLGISFRENRCTGYLNGQRLFLPPLSKSCPPARDLLSLTPDDLRTFGDACYDFIQTVPTCTFPVSLPADITPACRAFLANNLSYNGCVQNTQYRSDFARDSWRIYLNAGGELWRNTHDIIRLLDREGRTVDVITY